MALQGGASDFMMKKSRNNTDVGIQGGTMLECQGGPGDMIKMDTRIISCYSVNTMRSTILKQEPNLASLHAEDSQYSMFIGTKVCVKRL